MNRLCKKIKAYTMAEVMVVMTVIGIISLALYGTMKAQTNSATRYQYYAAFMNLKQAVGEIVADGYTLTGSTNTVKELSQKGNYANTDASFARGFCQKLTDIMNTVGTINCATATSSGFTAANANFATSNGMFYYNLGLDPSSNIYNVFIDINGTKGDYTEGKDVMRFYVNVNGEVYPYYTGNNNVSRGANNTDYLAASVQYRDTDGSLVVVERGVPYRNAVCDATNAYSTMGCAGAAGNYPTCNQTTHPGRYCEVVVAKPGF